MLTATLASLRTQARQRADMEGSDFVTDDELNGLINSSAAELYDLVVTTYEDHYVKLPAYAITTQSGIDSYDLPSDFYKLLGVDLVLSTDMVVTLKPFMFAERNRANIGGWGFATFANVRYQLRGSKIVFSPIPDSINTINLWYVPCFTKLVSDTDTLDGVNGWEEYVVVDAAIKMLTKEESDTTALMQQKEALRQRILAAASNRDSGAPQRIVDVQSDAFDDPFFRRLP